MNEHDIFTFAPDEVFESELDELTTDIPLDREHEFSDKFERNMRKLIKRRSKSYFPFICTAGRRAACIAVISMLLLANPITVNAIRERIFGYLREDYKDHIELESDRTYTDSTPETIEQKYHISAIPEGFDLVEETDTIIIHKTVYETKNDDNNREYIIFSQYTIDCFRININNVHTEFKEVTDGYI